MKHVFIFKGRLHCTITVASYLNEQGKLSTVNPYTILFQFLCHEYVPNYKHNPFLRCAYQIYKTIRLITYLLYFVS